MAHVFAITLFILLLLLIILKPNLKFNTDDYVTEQVWYKSKDGKKISMFIVHKKGIKLDKNNPTYLYGYGGFSISMTPYFSPSMIILGQKERTLDVTIKQQNSIFSISPTDMELTGEIEIISETPGRVRVKVSRENFPKLPKQYAMLIERPYIDVDIDKIQEKASIYVYRNDFFVLIPRIIGVIIS